MPGIKKINMPQDHLQYIPIWDRKYKKKKHRQSSTPKKKILDIKRHNNKIRVGHLKGNHFKIRLKKVLGVQKV